MLKYYLKQFLKNKHKYYFRNLKSQYYSFLKKKNGQENLERATTSGDKTNNLKRQFDFTLTSGILRKFML